MSDLTLPSIHLNGSGRRMLTEDYTTAYHALQAAIRAFQSVEFNARDYYGQGTDAYTRARYQRDAQLARYQRNAQLQHLAEVQHYLEAHLAHLSE
jgi:hypothetical protein